MKRIYLVFSCFLSFHLVFSASDYATYASSWCNRFIVDAAGSVRISQTDKEQLCLILASSRDRANATIAAQDPALKALRMVWQEWANVAQTRLNPSHERPFKVDPSQREQVMQTFWQAVDVQTNVSNEYNLLVQTTVYGTALESKTARQALTDARTQARVFMLQALADARTQLSVLYEIVFNKNIQQAGAVEEMLHKVKALLEDCAYDEQERGFTISEFLIHYLPSLAVHTFIEADKLHNQISNDAWQALFTLQEIGNYVWVAIETSRAAFYQALLDAIITVA
jgi:hypothetical protein